MHIEPASDFAQPLARRSDASTSHAAAKSLKQFAGRQGRDVLKIMRDAWPEPLAAEQIANRSMALTQTHVNRRLSDLTRLGHVQKTEFHHLNLSGRRAFKYALMNSRGGLRG